MKLAACRSCDAPIVWVVTSHGKRMPIDADPVKAACGFRLTAMDSETVAAMFTADPELDELLYVSHFSTCPNADAHRR